MNNLHLLGAASCALLYSKSNSVSVIQNYKVITFDELNGDAACIARIIEIFSLNKLRAEGEKLFSLTGLTVPDTEAVAEEITALLKHCTKFCRSEEEELGYCQRAVSEAQAALNTVKGANSISEMKSRGGSKADKEHNEHRYQLALSRVAEQQERVKYFRLLPGLLIGEAEHIGKGIDQRLLYSFVRTQRIPTELFTFFKSTETKNAVKFINEELEKLTKSVREVINKCTLPVDKYELYNGGILRVSAAKEYYRVDNATLRAVVSIDDYVKYRQENNKHQMHKQKLFQIN